MSEYKLVGNPPAVKGAFIKFGGQVFKVIRLEPLFYEFKHYSSSTGLEDGFTSDIFSIPDLIPPKEFIYYFTAVGIKGKLEVQIRYQAGTPRNTVVAKSTQRLNRFIAHYTDPFKFRFALLNGDTIEADIVPDHANTFGSIFFWGWKLVVVETTGQMAAHEPEDVRPLLVI